MTTAGETEREFVARAVAEENELCSARQRWDNPWNKKQLGTSPNGLSVKDFEMIRTLGTGEFPPPQIMYDVLCSLITEPACNICMLIDFD